MVVMTRVLVTSFEPFGEHALNSSLEVGRVLSRHPPPGIDLDWLILPVAASACIDTAWQRIESQRPALVLALGQAGFSPRVRLEDRAINLDHFYFPDNAGNLRQWLPVVPGGPVFHRTSLPIVEILDTLTQAGQPVEPSFSAGTFVCNHYYYHLLHRSKQTGLAPRALFVHLPLLPSQLTPGGKLPARPLQEQVDCVREVMLVCLG